MEQQATHSNPRGARYALWIALALGWFAAVILLRLSASGYLERLEGTTNGAFASWMLVMLSFCIASLLSTAFVIAVAVRTFWGTGRERLILCIGMVVLVALWFMGPVRNSQAAYVDGFLQWASRINPAQVRSWAASSGLSGATPTPPPHWWLIEDADKPLGVSASPGAVRALMTGPLPDDVRVFPSARVVFGWAFTGSFPRLLNVSAPGVAGPPTEFDRVTWYKVSEEVWIGIRDTP